MSDLEIAECIRHNSIMNRTVTAEQAEHIDWLAVARRNVPANAS